MRRNDESRETLEAEFRTKAPYVACAPQGRLRTEAKNH